MSDKPNEEPKLIIDEDWKTQVQREKDELKQQQQAAESQAAERSAAESRTAGAETVRAGDGDEPIGSADASRAAQPASKSASDPSGAVTDEATDDATDDATGAGDGSADTGQGFDGPPPPASLMLLINTLATQAMGAMGLIADDKGQPMPANFDFARHFIDTLAVLEEKTKGNVTDEEAAFLKEALHQLRMTFVAVGKQRS